MFDFEKLEIRRENLLVGGGLVLAGCVLSYFVPPIGAILAAIGGAAIIIREDATPPDKPK